MNKLTIFIIILVIVAIGAGMYLYTSGSDSEIPFIGGASDNLVPPPLPE